MPAEGQEWGGVAVVLGAGKAQHMGKLRRLTRRWIPLTGSRGSEGDLLATCLTWTRKREGTTAWRESVEHCEGVYGAAAQGQCDMAKIGLSEAQFPGMEMHPPTYNARSGATSIRRIPFASPQPFRLVDGGQRAHSRERTGRLRHARYVQRKRNSGSPKGRQPYGDGVPVVVVGVTPHQGERESRLQGQVAQVSTINQERRGTRNADSRSLTGDHPRRLPRRNPQRIRAT